MLLVSLLSSVAIAFGIGANLPQIARMSRSRSAAGQSPIGWAMGAITNLCLAYVNLVGLGATFLGLANLLTVVLCSTAIMLTLRFGAGTVSPITELAGQARPDALVEMPTQELVLLREAVDVAAQRRAERRAAEAAPEDPQPGGVPVLAGAPS